MKELPCLYGLLTDHEQSQLECPLVYYADIRNKLIKVGLNRYIGFLGNVSYTYHCPGNYALVDTLKDAAIYVIDVDVDCYFETSQLVINESSYSALYSLNVTVLAGISWNHLLDPRVRSIHWNSIQDATSTMKIHKMDEVQLLIPCWFSLLASASLCVVSFFLIIPLLIYVIRRCKNYMSELYELIVTNQTALLQKL